jgi:signal transduction histidine kinase
MTAMILPSRSGVMRSDMMASSVQGLPEPAIVSLRAHRPVPRRPPCGTASAARVPAVARTADTPPLAEEYHERMRPVFARFRRSTVWGFPAPDAVLALVVCVIAVASAVTGNPVEGPLVITLPVAIMMTLALVWRRRMPWLTVVLVAVAVYSVAAWSSESVAAVAGAGFVGILLVEEKLHDGVDYVFILLLFGGIWLLGRASSYWRGRVSVAEQRQQQAAKLAAAEERLRIARDVHDVVAHSLGAIAVQADAAEAALQVAPDRAMQPVRAIRDTAREALADIRRVLDVLHEDASPQGPSVPDDIAALVAGARATGMRVSLDVQPAGRPVPAEVRSAGYRIVQESLSNIRRHAPGAMASVVVRPEGDDLVLSITDDGDGVGSMAGGGPTPGAGYGIRGMRERAERLGGTLTCGPATGGGFGVRAALPLTERSRPR